MTKVANIMVGNIPKIVELGFNLPKINIWKKDNKSKEPFREYYRSLIFAETTQAFWLGKHERCPICDARWESGGYTLEPLVFRDKQINVVIWYTYIHYFLDHHMRPAVEFFRCLRDRSYDKIIGLSCCHRIGKGQFYVF